MSKTRNTLGGLLVALLMAGPATADRWKDLGQGHGYVSSAGTIRASGQQQPPSKVLSVARAFSGIPYVWAGNKPSSGFDCSGYVYEVLRLNGYEVPRMADEQFNATRRVAYKDLKPGDLVFFHTYLPGPSHVGFFLGEGDFIHASSAAEGVVVSQMTDGYYRERFLGGGRPEGWQGEPMQVADLVEPAVALPQPVATKALETAKQVQPEAAPELEILETELSNSPFAKRRVRVRQPVRVAVVPEAEGQAELAMEDWKLMLGETVAVGRLQIQGLIYGFASALGVDEQT